MVPRIADSTGRASATARLIRRGESGTVLWLRQRVQRVRGSIRMALLGLKP